MNGWRKKKKWKLEWKMDGSGNSAKSSKIEYISHHKCFPYTHTQNYERQVALVAQFDWIATIDCRRVSLVWPQFCFFSVFFSQKFHTTLIPYVFERSNAMQRCKPHIYIIHSAFTNTPFHLTVVENKICVLEPEEWKKNRKRELLLN